MATKFVLVGDSNARAVGRAARDAGLSYIGGPIAMGRLVDDLFFDINQQGIAEFHEEIRQNKRFTAEQVLNPEIPVLSTLGFNMQRIGQVMNLYIIEQGITLRNLSDAVIEHSLEDYKAGPLAYYREASRRGVSVYATYSPQRFPDANFDVAIELERRFAEKLLKLGVIMVDVRAETTDEAGHLLPKFATEREGDLIHANDHWGKLVVDQFLELVGGLDISADPETYPA